MNLSRYTKGIVAIAGVLIPTLNSWGVPLPDFLTVDWVEGLLLLFTPVAVIAFANKDGNGNNVDREADPNTIARSPALAGMLALILAALCLSGCAGTRAAYKAADGNINDVAKVMSEHYYALVRSADSARMRGTLSGSNLRTAQDVVAEVSPVITAMAEAGKAYEAVQSAENELELQTAVNNAARAISNLIDTLKSVGVQTRLEPIWFRDRLLVAGT